MVSAIGQKIKDLRTEQDLSGMDVCRLADIAPSYLKDLESGRIANPGFFTLEKIARALKISILYFLDDQQFAKESKMEDIRALHNTKWLDLLRSEDFQKYFDVTVKARDNGVLPEVLSMMIDAIIIDRSGNGRDRNTGNCNPE